jgi:polyether ionophore transport system ATP-binding protein
MSATICTEGLGKQYGRQYALHDLNLEVFEGEVLGYLGPNGAGKTTTIRLLLGLIAASAGHARIFDMDAHAHAAEIHKRLAYVPGEANLWPGLTGHETLTLLGNVHGTFDKAYRDRLIARFEFDPAKKVRSYSKGNRQKLSLIASLMTRAELLILDEPTSGLDPLMEQRFRESIAEAKANGQTIFLSSHILSEVEALCDRVAILREGVLLEIGTLAQMRHLAAVRVEATFDGPPPDVSNIPGVSSTEVEGQRLRCQVIGSIQPLVNAFANTGLRQLLSSEPSLEELFLSHYGARA